MTKCNADRSVPGKRWMPRLIVLAAAGVLAACGGGTQEGRSTEPAQGGGNTVNLVTLAALITTAPAAPPLQTLRNVTPPDPSGTEAGRAVGLDDYISDRAVAIRLGKALFWDMNVGSDGNTACATCHFQAGADNRMTNQINPGLANVNQSIASLFNKPFIASGVPGDVPAYGMKSGGKGGPNYTLALADFPLHDLAGQRRALSGAGGGSATHGDRC